MRRYRSPLRWGALFCLVFVLLLGSMPALSQGPNDLNFIMQVQARHENALMAIPGVNGVGIRQENGRYVLSVFVNEEINPNPELPDALERVRVVVVMEPGNYVTLMDDGPEHRLTYPPPVPMGVSTSNDQFCFQNAGTLGFRARDPATGQIGYITNNHIAAAADAGCWNGAPIGADQFQAGLGDTGCGNPGTHIGDLDRFVPIDLGLFTNNRVDAAFVASSTALVSNSILDIGSPVGSARDPILGESVQKSGRTTGLTTGVVTDVNVTVRIFSGIYGQCVARFIGQVRIEGIDGPFAQGGDSGSPVLSMAEQPVGLVFAKAYGTIANPLLVVLQELGVELF